MLLIAIKIQIVFNPEMAGYITLFQINYWRQLITDDVSIFSFSTYFKL